MLHWKDKSSYTFLSTYCDPIQVKVGTEDEIKKKKEKNEMS